jgi:hypothetical protein
VNGLDRLVTELDALPIVRGARLVFSSRLLGLGHRAGRRDNRRRKQLFQPGKPARNRKADQKADQKANRQKRQTIDHDPDFSASRPHKRR